MYRPLLVSLVVINFICAAEKIPSKYEIEDRLAAAHVDDKTVAPRNITYIDKSENLIRLPSIKTYYDGKSKRKPLKKSPKRTIQRIIKKSRSNKIKKVYVKAMISTDLPKFDYDNGQDDYSPRRQDTTTQINHKKKIKKYGTGLPRYPKPFHDIHKNYFKRNKREDRDLFILKDLDEVKFLKEDKDYNVVRAHLKKYW